MLNVNWTDDALLAAIKSGGVERDAALKRLYLRPGLREAVIRLVRDNQGSMQDAQDVFQETLILFDRNVREGRFEGRSLLGTYFVAIAKWHWLTLRRQQNRYTDLAPIHYEEAVESPEATTIRGEQRQMLQNALEQLGGRCKELLLLYQMEHPMEEIAQLMGYNNADVAKKEAYRCRIRLREVLEKTHDGQRSEWRTNNP
jgi:RNA polymerase sigma factor (sigma-70 family)